MIITENWKTFRYNKTNFWLHLPTCSILPPDSSAHYLLDCFINDSQLVSNNRNKRDVDLGFQELACFIAAEQIEKKENKLISRIAIAPTMKCNLDCSYCYLGAKNTNKFSDINDSSFNKIISFLDSAQLSDKINVVFIGGEPLLYSSLDQLIEKFSDYFNSKKIRSSYSITTNGTQLIRESVLKLINKWKIRVGISLDGSQQEHDRYRHNFNGKGSYSDVIKGFKAYKDVCCPDLISARATVSLKDQKLTESYKHLIKIGFNDIAFGIPDFTENSMLFLPLEKVFLDVEHLFSLIKDDFTKGKLLRFSWVSDIFNFLWFGKAKTVVCGAMRGYFCFDSNGDLKICHRFFNSSKNETENIVFQNSIDENLNELEALSKTNSCNICWARYLCAGECYHVALEMKKTNNEGGLKELSCKFRKKIITSAIHLYYHFWNKDIKLLECLSTIGKKERNR